MGKTEYVLPEDIQAKIDEAVNRKVAEILANYDNKGVKKRQQRVNPVAEELVTHIFFKDNGEYSDDVFLNVNGEKIVCQRGVPVKIKRKFVWAYERAQEQNAKLANILDEKAREYTNRSREVGLF